MWLKERDENKADTFRIIASLLGISVFCTKGMDDDSVIELFKCCENVLGDDFIDFLLESGRIMSHCNHGINNLDIFLLSTGYLDKNKYKKYLFHQSRFGNSSLSAYLCFLIRKNLYTFAELKEIFSNLIKSTFYSVNMQCIVCDIDELVTAGKLSKHERDEFVNEMFW